MTYTVMSEGIKLPDGTVFGAETKVMLKVVPGRTNLFRVYEVIGDSFLEKESGRNYFWKEMREIVSRFVNEQLLLGNRVFDENGEIKTFTATDETYC